MYYIDDKKYFLLENSLTSNKLDNKVYEEFSKLFNN